GVLLAQPAVLRRVERRWSASPAQLDAGRVQRVAHRLRCDTQLLADLCAAALFHGVLVAEPASIVQARLRPSTPGRGAVLRSHGEHGKIVVFALDGPRPEGLEKLPS